MLIAIAVIAACALIFFAFTFICYHLAFSVPKDIVNDPHRFPAGEQYLINEEKTHGMIDTVVSLPCEDVYIRSSDGLTLHARYYETAPGAPVQILFHGYRGNPFRDFCGGLQLTLACGCNALLVTQRAHGRSGGKCLTFGIKEQFDCLDWINYAISRFGSDTKIILDGISMGASTVLMAAGQDIPGNVVGVISDCGYSSPAGIIKKVLRDMHYPAFVYYFVRLGGRLFGHFDIESASPMSALEKCRIPVLFIHGEADDYVPCDMSRENFASCRDNATLVTFPGAGHGMSYVLDEEKYISSVKNFLADIIPDLYIEK